MDQQPQTSASLEHATQPKNPFSTDKSSYQAHLNGLIASALDHVHGKGIAHNDIKPGNILYNISRGAVLIEFGLSSDAEQNSVRVSIAGTPWYISPEFSTGRRGRGFPGDVWALGEVMLFLYQLLPLPEKTTEWRIAEVVGTNRSSNKALTDMLKWIEKRRMPGQILAIP